jgi:hypothetical protein
VLSDSTWARSESEETKAQAEKFNALFVWLISHQPAVLFSQNKLAITNQPAVLFSQNKPAPAISHQPNEQAANSSKFFVVKTKKETTNAEIPSPHY